MSPSSKRLTTWKDIAGYIGRDARTARRYEAERSLPIHRMPGESRSVVYAFTEELDGWLRRQKADPPAVGEPRDGEASAEASTGDGADPRPNDLTRSGSYPLQPQGRRSSGRGRSRPALLLLPVLGASLFVLAAAGLGPWLVRVVRPQAPASHAGEAAAETYYRAGEYAWRQRTPAALKQAVDDFTQAIVRRPDYGPAYVGLANSYDLMPEYGDMAAADAYPRAEAAARRAVLLSPKSGDAHATLGFVLFWWESNAPRGLEELETAVRLDPGSAQDHHWYANALAEVHDRRAQSEIEAASRLDPDSTPILLDRGWVASELQDWNSAMRAYAAVQAIHPDLPLLHSRLADLARKTGHYKDMLRESARASELVGDKNAETASRSAQAALQSEGVSAMWSSLAASGERRYAVGGQISPGILAADELHAGHPRRALQLLDDASRQHDPGVVGFEVNPDFHDLSQDPHFHDLLLTFAHRGVGVGEAAR